MHAILFLFSAKYEQETVTEPSFAHVLRKAAPLHTNTNTQIQAKDGRRLEQQADAGYF